MLSSRILTVWLVFVSVSVGIPMIAVSPLHMEPNSATTVSDGTQPEVVAAVDSKGIAHAPPA